MNGKEFHMSAINQPTLFNPSSLSFLLVVWVIFFKITCLGQFFKPIAQEIFNTFSSESSINSMLFLAKAIIILQ